MIPNRNSMALIEKFVCQLYVPRIVHGERAEMVVVSKEASAVRLKGYHQPKLHGIGYLSSYELELSKS